MRLKTPYVHVERFTEFSSAYAATHIQLSDADNPRLSSLDAVHQGEAYRKTIEHLLNHMFKSDVLSTITLRYIFDPEKKESPLEIVFFLRADGESGQEAQQNLLNVWFEFCSVFPNDLYTLFPVTEQAKFSILHLPISPDIAHIVEIRKHEDVVPAKYVAAGDYFYSPVVVTSQYQELVGALELISQESTRIVVNICFSPVMLEDEEERVIRQAVGQLQKFAQGFEVLLHSGWTVFEPDPNAKVCLLRFVSLLNSADCLYQFKLQVISERPIGKFVVKKIASTLLENYDLAIPEQEDLVAAQKTYQYQHPFFLWGGHSIWQLNDSPKTLRRVSHLLTLGEAATLFRLPILFHQRRLQQITYIHHVERIEQVGDRNFTIHGDNNAPVQVAFDKVFGEMVQRVQNAPIAKTNELRDLIELLDSMRAELNKATQSQTEDAKAVSERIDKLVTELQAQKPDKSDLEHHSNKLLRAAEKLKETMPVVLEIAGRVVKFIATLAL